MAKIKKIKIYTHHRHYLSASFGVIKKIKDQQYNTTGWIFSFFYFIGLVIIGIFNFFKNTVIAACFHTGNIIISAILNSFRALKNDFIATKKTFPQRVGHIFNFQFNRALFLFLIIAVIGWGALESLRVVAKALDIKTKILRTATVGNHYLSQAKDALASQDLNQAQNRFSLAYRTFSQGQSDMAQNGQILNQLLSLIPQKADADRLINAAGLISETGRNFTDLAKNLKTLKLTGAGIAATDKPAEEVFSDITASLTTAKSKLNLARSGINQINANNLPANNRVAFLDLRDKLNASQAALNNFSEIFALLKNLLLGDKNVLLLFENNNELRATGGFMGTFGSLSLKNGAIIKINVSSIYDLDGQLKENIQPPAPILNLVDRWSLRDANWFADFPLTAKKITSFYEKEGGETPDLIIAITPNLIIDWLKITGPLTLDKYGITLTPENFIEQTQAVSTVSDNLPTNSPKQIFADLVPILLQKIAGLDQNSLPAVIESLQNNLTGKQIVIYSKDENIQNQLRSFHWSGDVSQTDRDYLSIVNSNLGGTKTDLYVDQKISLNSTISDDGSVTNELEITRTNKMPKLALTNNVSFMRVYVPLGSTLISNIGFDYKNPETRQNKTYEIDEDVYNWEKNSVKDVLTGTTIGQESGKTFFGNWLNLEGGETKVIKLVYKLPFKINTIDRYSLLLQKQIGALPQNINWTLSFPTYQIAWKNFDTDRLNTSDLNSAIILDKDYFLGLVLQKR